MSSTVATRVDVREIAPRERHTVIFNHFDALAIGEAMELVNDHDPQPLRYQFKERFRGHFDWSYLESGPALWRVRIAKVQPASVPAATDSCCSGGACGG